MQLSLRLSKLEELLPLYAVICLGFLGYALTITLYIPLLFNKTFPLLPLTSSTALRATVSGLLLAMYPLGQFLGSPIIGNLADYYGRKNILLLSLFACMFGFISIGLSIGMHSLGLLFISSFLTGLCESNMAISQAIITDKAQDAIQKTKHIGYAYAACSLGYVIGPLMGGTVANKLSYSAPFWLIALGVFGLLLWIFYRLNDQYVANKNIPIEFIKTITAIKSIFNQKKLCKIYLINFLIFFAVQGLYRVVPLYVADRWQPSITIFSLLISYVSLLCMVANLFFLSKLAKRFSTQKLLSGLLIVGGALVIAIIIPAQFHWLWLIYGAAVIPTIMALPTCTTWLSQQAGAEHQGQVLGNNQALLVLGEAVSAAIGGLIAAIMVPLPIALMGAILLMAGVMVKKIQLI